MSFRPSLSRVTFLIVGSVLFSLSVVSIFYPLIRYIQTPWEIACVFVIAGLGIFFGRSGLDVPIIRKIVKSIIYAPFLAFLALIVLLFIPVQPVGRLIAHRDVSAERYRAIIPRSPWHKELSAMLLSRYGLESSVRDEGCFPIVALYTYYLGYQAVMVPAIKTRYGHDIVKECTEDAKSAWEKLIEKNIKANQTDAPNYHPFGTSVMLPADPLRGQEARQKQVPAGDRQRCIDI